MAWRLATVMAAFCGSSGGGPFEDREYVNTNVMYKYTITHVSTTSCTLLLNGHVERETSAPELSYPIHTYGKQSTRHCAKARSP